mgnify:FL=1
MDKTLPADIRRNLMDYLNDTEGTVSLTDETVSCLKTLKGLTPSKTLTLYRGLFFAGDHVGHDPGEEFLRGHDKGDSFLVSSTRYMSWTSVRGVSHRFSLNTEELIFRDMAKDFIRKNEDAFHPMGVVLS